VKSLFLLGASGDIGRAIADKFTNNGYAVIAPSRNEINLESRPSIEDYFRHTKANDKIDVFIYCAGWNTPRPFQEVTYDDLDKANSINAIGFFRILQEVVAGMIKNKNGYVLAISSLYSFMSREGRLPYVMSKHALNGVVKTAAIEFGKYNIKINALSPGFVDTKMTRKNNDELTIKKIEERIPLGYLATAADIANVAFFICSEENAYITGQNIIVDGGYSIGGI
jgi:3-oxoacyl-[acyl-carrier protein] reductase